jgi:hypothetical protein
MILEKKTENIKCFDFLCNFYLKHFLFSEELSEICMIKSVLSLQVKYRLFLLYFNKT